MRKAVDLLLDITSGLGRENVEELEGRNMSHACPGPRIRHLQ
jgi:hypothetical protein